MFSLLERMRLSASGAENRPLFLSKFVGPILFTVDGHLWLDNAPRKSTDFVPIVTHRTLRRVWERVYCNTILSAMEIPRCYICSVESGRRVQYP